MEFVYGILMLFVIVIIGLFIHLGITKRKQKEAIYSDLTGYGEVSKSSLLGVDYVLSRDRDTFLIKLMFTPNAKEVSFNSKRHWQIFTSNGKKMYETNGFADIEGKKIVVVYPNPGKIVKYINENEVVFVTPTLDVFGMNILKANQLEDFFNMKG